jgi:ATP-binding cassette subfamily E protein 1
MIRSLLCPENYVLVVEHDLSILDYMSDFICCLYGVPGAYGVVTHPASVRDGINIFLQGFVPSENLRFRDEELTFKVTDAEEMKQEDLDRKNMAYNYPAMEKTFGN